MTSRTVRGPSPASRAWEEGEVTPARKPQFGPADEMPAVVDSVDTVDLGGDLHAGSLLEVHYQPIVHLRTGKILSYEVLSRPLTNRFSSPRELIDAMTRARLIGEFGRYVRQRCTSECPAAGLSINVEPNEFDEGLLVRPDDPIFSHRQPVYLEITESVPIEKFEQCFPILEELRRRGIRLAVDDLGAGFSNLKYISELRPALVKLDRKLLASVTLASRHFRLLRSIVRLVHEMEAQVVAEGIETSEELYAAREAAVDYGQGFLLGRPKRRPEPVLWPID